MFHNIRMFWVSHEVALGGVLIVLALTAAFAAAVIFVRAPQPATGRVVSFDIPSSERRSAPAAIVRVEGRLARIKVRHRISCLIGEDMALSRYDTPIGSFYQLAAVSRPCRAADRP